MTDTPDPLWLLGDEDGGIALMCRECDTGGDAVQRWDAPAPPPDAVYLAGLCHRLTAHPPEPPDGRPWYWSKWCAMPDHHEWIHGELARLREREAAALAALPRPAMATEAPPGAGR